LSPGECGSRLSPVPARARNEAEEPAAVALATTAKRLPLMPLGFDEVLIPGQSFYLHLYEEFGLCSYHSNKPSNAM